MCFHWLWSHLIPQKSAFVDLYKYEDILEKLTFDQGASSLPEVSAVSGSPVKSHVLESHTFKVLILCWSSVQISQILLLVKICFQYLHKCSTQSHYHKMGVSKTWQHWTRSVGDSFIFYAVFLSVNSRFIKGSNIEDNVSLKSQSSFCHRQPF